MTEVDFWEAVDDSVSSSERKSLQKRKDERMKICGNAMFVSEKPNGGRKMIRWFCKDPRCDACNERKGQEIRDRIEILVESGASIAYIETPKEIADRLCKKLGRDNYLRIPHVDKDFLFILNEDNTQAPEYVVDGTFIESYDWKKCATKQGVRIMSGMLGKSEAREEKSTGKFRVNTIDLLASPYDTVDKAYRVTCTEVIAWKQPESLEENTNVRQYFNGIFVKNIMSLGGSVHYTLQYKKQSRNLLLDFLDREFE